MKTEDTEALGRWTAKPIVPTSLLISVLLFIMYTTLISSLSLNHHYYADDTQLCFSFYPQDLDLCIACLQNALHQISSWITVNVRETKLE